jgi:hypothetical protein
MLIRSLEFGMMQSLTPVKKRHRLSGALLSQIHQHPNLVHSPAATITHLPALYFSNQSRHLNKCIEPKPSSLLPTSFIRTNLGYISCIQRQQCRCWNESARNPVYIAMEEEERKKAEAERNDVVGKRLREIEATPGDTQTIWTSVFLDGKLVNGTQITIPKHNTNIDMIKYAVKEKCSEILTDIAAITFQVLPTRYKRKKSRRKLTRKNRILKADVLYDMALHGGESEDAGIIVKAHTRKMQDGNHYSYGTYYR